MKTTGGPTGGHVTEQLAAYLDDELPENERDAVREHLRQCSMCGTDLATLRVAKQLLRGLPPATPPRSFKLSVDQVAAAGAGSGRARQAAQGPRLSRLPRLALGLRVSAAGVFLLMLLLVGADFSGAGVDRAMTAPQLAAGGQPQANAAPGAAIHAPNPQAVDGVIQVATPAAATSRGTAESGIAPAAAPTAAFAAVLAGTPTANPAPNVAGGLEPSGSPTAVPAFDALPLIPAAAQSRALPSNQATGFPLWPVELVLGLIALGLLGASFFVRRGNAS
ncbi:MAG: zf-HC2 domain-containing protein [Chloroflexia bacterium]